MIRERSTALRTWAQSLSTASVDFAEVVEAAERDIALLQGRQRADRRLARERIVAPEGVGQADRFLRVAVVVEARRIEIGVGEAVVDGRKAGGARIGQPA